MVAWSDVQKQALWTKGVAGQIIRRGELMKWDGSSLVLKAPLTSFADPTVVRKVREFVSKVTGFPVRVQIMHGD